MCGIVGYIGTQDVKDILLNGLEKLEYRGKRVIIIRIEKKQGSLYTKGTLNLAFYLQFS